MKHVLTTFVVSLTFAQCAFATCENEVAGLEFSAYKPGILQRMANSWQGRRTASKVVNLTANLTDAALEEVDELLITVKDTVTRELAFPTMRKGVYNGVREFYALPAPLVVKNGDLQSYKGTEPDDIFKRIYSPEAQEGYRLSRQVKSEEIVQVLGLRYQNGARDFFEELKTKVEVEKIKVGDHVAVHLSRRIFNNAAYDMLRVQLGGNAYPHGKVVKILEDRYIFASASRRFFAVPKDLILQARKMEAWKQEANDAALAAGGFYSIRFDDRFKYRADVFLVHDPDMGAGWIYMGGETLNERDGSVTFSALNITVPKAAILDRGAEFVPSTYTTVYGYSSPYNNPRMTYELPSGGGG